MEKIIDDEFFIELLSGTKHERTKMLRTLNSKSKKMLIELLINKIPTINNAEDKMIAIWIAGELKDEKIIKTIHKELGHRHGGVRRMVCSALGKIRSVDSVDVLHRALQDVKPQVRQYSSKALETIGNEKTIIRMKALLNNPNEAEYVRRSYIKTIESIENKMQNK